MGDITGGGALNWPGASGGNPRRVRLRLSAVSIPSPPPMPSAVFPEIRQFLCASKAAVSARRLTTSAPPSPRPPPLRAAQSATSLVPTSLDDRSRQPPAPSPRCQPAAPPAARPIARRSSAGPRRRAARRPRPMMHSGLPTVLSDFFGSLFGSRPISDRRNSLSRNVLPIARREVQILSPRVDETSRPLMSTSNGFLTS